MAVLGGGTVRMAVGHALLILKEGVNYVRLLVGSLLCAQSSPIFPSSMFSLTVFTLIIFAFLIVL